MKTVLLLSLAWMALCAGMADPDLIYWSGKKLSWADFKGKHDENNPLDAYTYYQVSFDPQIKAADSLIIKISCVFSKSRSSVRKPKMNDTLLMHEQGHFDIAEVNALRFCKKLSACHFTAANAQSLLDSNYKNAMEELKQEQEKYDAETDHSMNRKKQTEWLKKIADELKQEKPYSSLVVRKKFEK